MAWGGSVGAGGAPEEPGENGESDGARVTEITEITELDVGPPGPICLPPVILPYPRCHHGGPPAQQVPALRLQQPISDLACG